MIAGGSALILINWDRCALRVRLSCSSCDEISEADEQYREIPRHSENPRGIE